GGGGGGWVAPLGHERLRREAIERGEPRLDVVDHWFQQHAGAHAADADTVAGEAIVLRQPHRLAAAVPEQLCRIPLLHRTRHHHDIYHKYISVTRLRQAGFAGGRPLLVCARRSYLGDSPGESGVIILTGGTLEQAMVPDNKADYRPQIDALRAIAVLGVLYTHFWQEESRLGHLG